MRTIVLSFLGVFISFFIFLIIAGSTQASVNMSYPSGSSFPLPTGTTNNGLLPISLNSGAGYTGTIGVGVTSPIPAPSPKITMQATVRGHVRYFPNSLDLAQPAADVVVTAMKKMGNLNLGTFTKTSSAGEYSMKLDPGEWTIQPQDLRYEPFTPKIITITNTLVDNVDFVSHLKSTASPTPSPTVKPSPSSTPAPSYSAPTMVYPQNGETLILEGAYMFKVNPVFGATGYLFGFFQNGKAIFENYANLKTLSPNGEFVIPENMKGHELFKAGKVDVWVRALINNKWTDARIITITLTPSTLLTPKPTPTASSSASITTKSIAVKLSMLSGNVRYRTGRLYIPAPGVTVEITNLKTGQKIKAITNWFGNYSVGMKNGKYIIRAYDNKKTNFTPSFTPVNLTKDTNNISFIGY